MPWISRGPPTLYVAEIVQTGRRKLPFEPGDALPTGHHPLSFNRLEEFMKAPDRHVPCDVRSGALGVWT